MPPVRADDYTPERGRWLVERYASGEPGTGLAALHRAEPEAIPSPLRVRQWRRDWPAFDAAMVEAEAVRADALMEQTVEVADSDKLAAVSRNGIMARQRMAEALAPERYKGKGEAGMVVGVILTDAQLYAIAAGADPAGLLATPTAPPLCASAGFTARGGTIPLPQSFPDRTFPVEATDVPYTDLAAGDRE